MLKARVITALLLLAGFLAVLFILPAAVVAVVFAFVAALAAWEWAGLMRAGNNARIVFGGFALFSCLLLWQQSEALFPLLWLFATAFWLLLVPLWLWRGWRLGAMGYLLGWVLLMSTWAALLGLHGRSPLLLLAVMALVWVADIAAYFGGRTFGRHKLAPSISPGKTWEGVAGGVIGVLVYGLLASAFLPVTQGVTWLPLLGFLLLMTVFSIIGDLFESLIKRQANLKDSSQLLPGHGGILDRIDSQISTLPLVALTLHWMSI